MENQLEGRVVIDFRNGSVTVGHAERNRLVGVVRKFDENHKFKYIENVISGKYHFLLP